MIERTKSFTVTNADGSKSSFLTIEEAKRHEFKSLLGTCPALASNTVEEAADRMALAGGLSDFLLSNSERIVDLLTTKGTSRSKARKVNGATRKPRTPKPAAVV